MAQTTVADKVEISGIGLHSGKNVNMILLPAAINTGILFRLKHLNNVIIQPNCEYVSANGLATTLMNKTNQGVSTVEHLLATLRGLGIDNILIDLDSNEVPILDGSALKIIEAIEKTGLHLQNANKKYLKIIRQMQVVGDNKFIKVSPANEFSVDYTIDFPHPAIGKQNMSFKLMNNSFKQIAHARTFGFLKEVEYLNSKGLALGGSLDNAVVLGDKTILNTEGLRSPLEFVEHKILDFIGDMAVAPYPILGHFEIYCSGHNHNNLFLRQLLKQQDFYCELVSEANYNYAESLDYQAAFAY